MDPRLSPLSDDLLRRRGDDGVASFFAEARRITDWLGTEANIKNLCKANPNPPLL